MYNEDYWKKNLKWSKYKAMYKIFLESFERRLLYSRPLVNVIFYNVISYNVKIFSVLGGLL